MHTWNVDIFIKEPVKLESHPKHCTQLFLNTVRIYLKGKHKKNLLLFLETTQKNNVLPLYFHFNMTRYLWMHSHMKTLTLRQCCDGFTRQLIIQVERVFVPVNYPSINNQLWNDTGSPILKNNQPLSVIQTPKQGGSHH